MVIPVTPTLIIEYGRSDNTGAPWIVRLYRKRLVLRQTLASDWFLEEAQARAYAESLAADLRAGVSPERVRTRPPGWTLHRPAR
jgi:hypothetical protein